MSKRVRAGPPVRTALVTGASGTLGRAIVGHLQANGFRVAVHWHTRLEPAAALADAAEGSFVAHADVADWDAVQAMVDDVHERFGGSVGVVVNAAGARHDGLLAGQSPAEWRRTIDVNLLGTFHVCRATLPEMLRARYGRILNIVSPAGLIGSPGQTAYSAAKAGVVALTRSLAHECGRRGITVNCASPGLMESAMTDDLSDEVRAAVLDRAAIPTLVEPEEICGVVDLVLAAPHLTGQVLSVDGGISA